MTTGRVPRDLAAWSFGLLVLATGVANLVFVHPVPAIAYLAMAVVFLPPTSKALRRLGIRVPAWLKLALGILLVMFTLGVSDLGDMLD